MEQQLKLTVTIPKDQLGYRLDWILAKLLPSYSRSCIKKWILNQNVLVDGNFVTKSKKKMSGGEIVTINVNFKKNICFKSQNIPLDIIYEDEYIIVINKSHNFVVHPGAGNLDNTVLNALLHYYPPIINVPRAGIIHRIDKDTTGLMIIAKTITAQMRLVKLLQLRKITREYEAITVGHLITDGTINKPMSRHPIKRIRMSVCSTGKPAITHYRVIEHFREHTHLRLRLETGRTHQIRVHMASINHPIVGDQLYGKRLRIPKGASKKFSDVLRGFNRQALHAVMLRLYHPVVGVEMKWVAPIQQDMLNLIEAMRIDSRKYEGNIR